MRPQMSARFARYLSSRGEVPPSERTHPNSGRLTTPKQAAVTETASGYGDSEEEAG
jgi:hypothetical protein